MGGIYDSSSTGQRSMLSRVAHPFSKGTGVSGVQNGQIATSPSAACAKGKVPAPKVMGEKELCDTLEPAPGSADKSGTSKAAEKARGTGNNRLLRNFLAQQSGPTRKRAQAPTPPQPSSPSSQI